MDLAKTLGKAKPLLMAKYSLNAQKANKLNYKKYDYGYDDESLFKLRWQGRRSF